MKRKPMKINKLSKLQPNLSKILSKDLKWLAPYLEAVKDLVPLHKIKKIDYYMNRSHQFNEHHKAITHRLANNKTHLIFIRTNLAKEKRIPLSMDHQEDCLFFLAHELAHCVPEGWAHSKTHFHLMSIIFSKFGEVLNNIDFEINRNKK